MSTLQERQINNIIKKLDYHDFVYVHDKRLLPFLKLHNVKIIRKISDNIKSAGRWSGKAPVTPCMLLHWIKTGRIIKDELYKYIDAIKIFDEPTYENAKKLALMINDYGGGRGLFALRPILHKSEFYVCH